MKMNTIVKRIEKVTEQKFQLNNNMHWLKIDNQTISFFENGIGSGDVCNICIKTDCGDDNPWNSNCYNSFHRTIKSAINYINK